MATFSIISFVLIILLLMSMFSKARPWSRIKLSGKVIQEVQLNFLQRARFHRSSLLAIDMALVFGLSTGWLPAFLAGIIAVFSLGIIFIPMKYTFTSKGVGGGETAFRTWDEFTGVSTRPTHVELEHTSYFGRLALFVKPTELDGVFAKIFSNRFQTQSV